MKLIVFSRASPGVNRDLVAGLARVLARHGARETECRGDVLLVQQEYKVKGLNVNLVHSPMGKPFEVTYSDETAERTHLMGAAALMSLDGFDFSDFYPDVIKTLGTYIEEIYDVAKNQ